MYPFNQKADERDALLRELTENSPRLKLHSQFISDSHQVRNSILFRYETDENFGSYSDGKPITFSKWFVIVNLSKSNQDGLATEDDLRDELQHVVFHSEFLIRLPRSLDRSRCQVSLPSVQISGMWCTKCNGPFDCSNLNRIMHQYIQPSLIPRSTLIYIGKEITPIDWNNVNDLQRVRALAATNYRTIVHGLQAIETIDRKLNALLTERSEIAKSIFQLGHDSNYFEKLVEMIKK